MVKTDCCDSLHYPLDYYNVAVESNGSTPGAEAGPVVVLEPVDAAPVAAFAVAAVCGFAVLKIAI